MKYFIQGRWWTELGRQIKLNDILQDIKRILEKRTALDANAKRRNHK